LIFIKLCTVLLVKITQAYKGQPCNHSSKKQAHIHQAILLLVFSLGLSFSVSAENIIIEPIRTFECVKLRWIVKYVTLRAVIY